MPSSPASLDARSAVPPRESSRSLFGLKPRLEAVALVILLVLLGGGFYWYFGRDGAPAYVTQAVTRGTVARTVTATGSVNPDLTITVGTYVSGVIQRIDCDFNTVVKKG